MQKNIYLIVLLFSLVSCYTYQVKKPVETPVGAVQNNQPAKKKVDNSNIAAVQLTEEAAEIQGQKKQSAPVNVATAPMTVQEKLAVGKNYRIKADGSTYKIIVDKWESDTLVAHPVKRPETILKFHKNQIDSENIAEKRFSQPIADIITVLVYAGIGVGIYAFIKGM